MEKSKVALRLAYLGTRYAGFQVQPGLPTVQAAVVEALRRAHLIERIETAHFTASGRTDKGVHALDAVIAFETEARDHAVPRLINTHLPNEIWTWARAEVSQTFDARRDAVLREYQYFLCDEQLDVSAMREASDLLVGVRDFQNFSLDKRRSAVRKIFSSDIMVLGGGQQTVEWFGKMLDPKVHTEGIRSAPAAGLILTRVEYKNVEFIEDSYAKKRAQKHIHEALLQNSVMVQVLKRFNKQMIGGTPSGRA